MEIRYKLVIFRQKNCKLEGSNTCLTLSGQDNLINNFRLIDSEIFDYSLIHLYTERGDC